MQNCNSYVTATKQFFRQHTKLWIVQLKTLLINKRTTYFTGQEPPHQPDAVRRLVVARDGDVDESQRRVRVAQSDDGDVDVRGFRDRLVIGERIGDNQEPRLAESGLNLIGERTWTKENEFSKNDTQQTTSLCRVCGTVAFTVSFSHSVLIYFITPDLHKYVTRSYVERLFDNQVIWCYLIHNATIYCIYYKIIWIVHTLQHEILKNSKRISCCFYCTTLLGCFC